MQVSDLPLLNAVLNSLSTVFLILGWWHIRAKRASAHKTCMLLAVLTSTLFLASYLTYHALKEGLVTKFPTEYGTARTIYLGILLTHTILAVVILPMVIMTLIRAFRNQLEKHRRLARWTLPIWLYVSVTGVVIYLMLYQWFPPPALGG